MQVCMIWAMTQNRVIGDDGGLPWRLPKDMRHFMETTMGKPVIMGRKTFESMKSPLPGRLNIVMTRDASWQPSSSDVVVTDNLADAIAAAHANAAELGLDEIMIIGGAEIYKLGLPQATRLYVTYIHAEIEGDTIFPEFPESDWQTVSSVDYPKDDKHDAAFTIKVLERSTG